MSGDRDRTLEQALTHELRAAGTPDREACVDAETLGAWADGGLDAAQMTSVELHVSRCARCQSMAGAFARSAPAAPSPETSGAFSFWRWWLAPLAAAAAAVTLWMVVPEQRRLVVTPPPATAPAQETFTRSQPKEQPSPTAPAPAKPAEEQRAAAERLQRATTPGNPREERRERSAAESEKKEVPLAAKKQNEAARTPGQDTTVVTVTGAVAAAPAVAPPSAPATPVASPSAPAARELQMSARRAFAPIEIVSPDPSRRWRIVNGTVERSEDGGASWIAIQPGAGESITGGTAPARSICWLIGSSGLVMVTTDGVTFARVPLPERVDLTAITATDARTATVTAADGRRFRTDDAGRTWRQN